MPAAAEKARRLPSLEYAPRAVLLVDVVESVRLIQRDEHGAVARWLAFVDQVRTRFIGPDARLTHSGLGDGMLIQFPDVRRAAAAAFAIQAASRRENEPLPAPQQLHLRMGVDAGDVIVAGQDIYGRSVNLAARLATLAGPGEIVVSATAREALTPALDADVEDLGECFLKHFDEPVRAYRIGPPGPRPLLEPGIPARDLLPTIAVVPFAIGDADEDYRWVGQVLAEEMIRDLSRAGDIHVISRLSTNAFAGRNADFATIGASLNANYVLSGRCQIDAKSVILHVELADFGSRQIVWSRRHRGGTAGVLSGRSELVDRVVQDVAAAILARELRLAQSHALPTLKSYTLLLGAIALMHRLSRTDFDQARGLLQSLIDRASRQAVPHAWLATWHVLRVHQGWSPDPDQDGALALDNTRRALDTDPDCALALAAEAFALTSLKRLDDADTRLASAIASNPSEALAWCLKGTVHAFRGEGTEAVRCTLRAQRLSPLDPLRYFYDTHAATAFLAAHQFERALALAQRSLRANRTHTSTLRALIVANWRLGHRDAARAALQELLRLDPKITVSRWRQGSPSADYPIGQEWARTFHEAGMPI